MWGPEPLLPLPAAQRLDHRGSREVAGGTGSGTSGGCGPWPHRTGRGAPAAQWGAAGSHLEATGSGPLLVAGAPLHSGDVQRELAPSPVTLPGISQSRYAGPVLCP